MSKISPARMRDGTSYAGISQYKGNGVQRSCGRCMQHKLVGGGKMVQGLGWVCAECAPAKK